MKHSAVHWMTPFVTICTLTVAESCQRLKRKRICCGLHDDLCIVPLVEEGNVFEYVIHQYKLGMRESGKTLHVVDVFEMIRWRTNPEVVEDTISHNTMQKSVAQLQWVKLWGEQNASTEIKKRETVCGRFFSSRVNIPLLTNYKY